MPTCERDRRNRQVMTTGGQVLSPTSTVANRVVRAARAYRHCGATSAGSSIAQRHGSLYSASIADPGAEQSAALRNTRVRARAQYVLGGLMTIHLAFDVIAAWTGKELHPVVIDGFTRWTRSSRAFENAPRRDRMPHNSSARVSVGFAMRTVGACQTVGLLPPRNGHREVRRSRLEGGA